MKRIFLTILLAAFIAPLVSAQVTWKASGEKNGNDTYCITITGTISPEYHIYDTGEYPGGPNPTVITFASSGDYELVGDLQTVSEVKREYSDMFGMEIGTIYNPAVFTQDVRLTGESAEVALNVEWMSCTDESCTPPDDVDLTVQLGEPAAEVAVAPASGRTHTGDGGLWGMILAAILWGLAALVTPCVFPMIPMTVSFFIKGSEDKRTGRFRALMYGIFIVLLYTLPIAIIIVLTRIIGGNAVTADIFNWLATHWLPNVLFFVIFMAFAASFFGAFEIILPSKLVNGSDQQVDKRKGLGGVLFLALTLVLVSFSCTGPIVGSVLIKSTSGEFWAPIVTMLVFSTVFALPFVLFALFPGFLKKLPKSGGWLNSVKIVLGFIEIALGFKFLSTADQVYHWGLLDREVYLAIWIVCFTMLGFYLLGKLKFKNDSDVKYISTLRLVLAIVDFTFVVYMIPGMWGAPLKALSGYLPPMETQDFVLGQPSAALVPASTAYDLTVTPADGDAGSSIYGTPRTSGAGTYSSAPKYSDILKLPLGLSGYFDLDEAEAAAKAAGKPLFIDFTGHGCVNCREMESRVWSDPRVLELLRNEFVICALYTDDKLQAPQESWRTNASGKVLKTIGKINADIALTKYGVAAQPNYVIQDPDGNIVCPARGYNLDIPSFIAWLRSAL